MGFKEEYAKFLQPSKEREAFVYNAITRLPREQILKNMKPITVTRPDGAKITYKVMPDYLTIDGIRVPMSGTTAQRVADYFGLSLPNSKQTKEIYQHSVKIPAKPLSGSGTNVNGKNYSGKDVVETGVGYAPFAINYNDKINQQLNEKGVKPGDIVSGFAKDVVAPPPGTNTLGLHGFYDSTGKPIQGGSGQTPHDTTIHSEYGAFVRLVSPDVVITYPDGKVETKPANSEYMSSRYTPEPKNKTPIVNKPTTDYKQKEVTNKPVNSIFDEVDKFLGQLGFASEENAAIYKYAKSGPPKGYRPLGPGENNNEIGKIAKTFLNKPFGSENVFELNNQMYLAKVEPHFHPIPPEGTSPSDYRKYPKPWGWHKGVTVYKNTSTEYKPEAPDNGRSQILQRLDLMLDNLNKGKL